MGWPKLAAVAKSRIETDFSAVSAKVLLRSKCITGIILSLLTEHLAFRPIIRPSEARLYL